MNHFMKLVHCFRVDWKLSSRAVTMPDVYSFGIDPITCHAWNKDRSRWWCFLSSSSIALFWSLLYVKVFLSTVYSFWDIDGDFSGMELVLWVTWRSFDIRFGNGKGVWPT